MDATTSPLFLPRTHTLVGSDDACREIHVITDAEWSDFPPLRLNILDTEPAACNFPRLEELIPVIAMERGGACYDPREPF